MIPVWGSCTVWPRGSCLFLSFHHVLPIFLLFWCSGRRAIVGLYPSCQDFLIGSLPHMGLSVSTSPRLPVYVLLLRLFLPDFWYISPLHPWGLIWWLLKGSRLKSLKIAPISLKRCSYKKRWTFDIRESLLFLWRQSSIDQSGNVLLLTVTDVMQC